jgi:hypothetical protein
MRDVIEIPPAGADATQSFRKFGFSAPLRLGGEKFSR